MSASDDVVTWPLWLRSRLCQEGVRGHQRVGGDEEEVGKVSEMRDSFRDSINEKQLGRKTLLKAMLTINEK